MTPQPTHTHLTLLALAALSSPALAQGSGFVYQGELQSSGSAVASPFDAQFRLFDNAGVQVGPALCVDDVQPDSAGRFTVSLDFGPAAFSASPRTLDIAVRLVPSAACSDASGFTTLSPRQPVSPAPLAIAATNAQNLAGQPASFYLNAANLTGAFRAGSASNTIDASASGAAILSGGSAAQPNRVLGASTNAVLGGGTANTVDLATNAFLGGGSNNRVRGAHSVVGGGLSNDAASQFNVVAGGANNRTTNLHSTVSGGTSNEAIGTASTIAGGATNVASAGSSAIGGGTSNTASGFASSVPGGEANVAGGDWSVALGRRAKVRTTAQSADAAGDEGTFIFADSTNADFASSAPNQFLVRAGGGVGINTSAPLAPLHVSAPAGSTLGRVVIAPGIANSNSELFLSENVSNTIGATLRYEGTLNQVQVLGRSNNADSLPHVIIERDTGNVGIATGSPTSKLDVNGTASASSLLSRGLVQASGEISTGLGLRFPDGTFQTSAAGLAAVPVVANNGFGGHTVSFDGVRDNVAQLTPEGFSVQRDAAGAITWTKYPTLRRRRTSNATWQTWAAGTGVPATLDLEMLNAGFTVVQQRWTFTIIAVRDYRWIVGDDGGPLEELTLEVSFTAPPAPLVVPGGTGAPSVEALYNVNSIANDATILAIGGTDLLFSRIDRDIQFTRVNATLRTRFLLRQNTRQGNFMASWWAANDQRAGQLRGRASVSGTLSTLTAISNARPVAYRVRVDTSRSELFEEFIIEASVP